MGEALEELEKVSTPVLERMEAEERARFEVNSRRIVADIANETGVPFEELWPFLTRRHGHRCCFEFPGHCPIVAKVDSDSLRRGDLDFRWSVWGWPNSYHTSCATLGIALAFARREYEANKKLGEYD